MSVERRQHNDFIMMLRGSDDSKSPRAHPHHRIDSSASVNGEMAELEHMLNGLLVVEEQKELELQHRRQQRQQHNKGGYGHVQSRYLDNSNYSPAHADQEGGHKVTEKVGFVLCSSVDYCYLFSRRDVGYMLSDRTVDWIKQLSYSRL